jgi:hypothetical protein
MYDELVYLLDLCTYSYQLHNQTLIWPMDPYYEQWSDSDLRQRFMDKVHQLAHTGQLKGFHGPGSLSGLKSNPALDPVISDYSLIDPWRPSVIRQRREQEGWILYNTPPQITNRVERLYLAQYDPPPKPVVSRPRTRPGKELSLGKDWLYCFEGGTGETQRSGNPAWSMMGFVLAMEVETNRDTSPVPPYDLYIVFRGSRSGDPRALTALSLGTGNPDWVTDMEFGLGIWKVANIQSISIKGSVSPGFALSMRTMLPTIMECLNHIQTEKKNAPREIHVTGHSLGAALAVHFTSAVLLGDWYGYDAVSTKMVEALRKWPWNRIKLTTFALPVVGGGTFQETFNKEIGSHRVYLKGDPVTLTVRHYPVGIAYEIDPEVIHQENPSMDKEKIGWFGDPCRHEPFNIRNYLIKDLQRLGKLGPRPLEDPLTQEPWKVFANFRELIKDRFEKDSDSRIDQILGPKFDTQLSKYLDIWKDFLTTEEKRQLITRLEKEIGQSWKQSSLMKLYGDAKSLFSSSEASASHFFGLCLFLGTAFKASLREARNNLDVPPFRDLPLQ